MGYKINLSGMKFSRLTVISYYEDVDKGKPKWLCRCDCGNIKVVLGEGLRSGNTKSCGCLQIEAIKKIATKHSLRNTRTYSIWNGIITRCNNSKHGSYKFYGAKGISVCYRWLKFENFVEDMGLCPDGMSIERLNFLGNYEPSNCKWATSTEQNRNKSSNMMITFNNETLCMSDWAKRIGIKRETIARRIKLNWPIDKILTKPVQQQHTSSRHGGQG